MILISLPLAGILYFTMKLLRLKAPEGWANVHKERLLGGLFLFPERRPSIGDRGVEDLWEYSQFLGMLWFSLILAAGVALAAVVGIIQGGPFVIAGGGLILAAFIAFYRLVDKGNWLNLVAGIVLLGGVIWLVTASLG